MWQKFEGQKLSCENLSNKNDMQKTLQEGGGEDLNGHSISGGS